MKLKSKNSSRRSPIHFLLFLIIILIATVSFLLVKFNLFGTTPVVTLHDFQGNNIDSNPKILAGRYLKFKFDVQTPQSDICDLEITLKQNEEKWRIENYSQPKPFLIPKNLKQKTSTFHINTENLPLTKLVQGPATLDISVSDCSYFMRKTKKTYALEVDLAPPLLSLTSNQHYINQGGADLVTYNVSDDAVLSGVKIGNYNFKGFKKPASKNEHFAFFVFSYDLPSDTPIEVYAVDAAGNETKQVLVPAKFFPKSFRQRELPIDDQFIQNKVLTIIDNTPGVAKKETNLENFITVNRELRKKNAQDLVDLGLKSEETFFWSDAFKPLVNSAIEANFADYRTYVYNGEKVDQQVHLGFDMAATKNYPILASNRGKIIFAGYLGIYGNTVVIDHGYGLQTLYGHLSQIDVAVGDIVERDQKIGNSGETGLAGGDHLHYSMLIGGVQTNPIEFWDQHWIDDHVYLRVSREIFGKN